MMPSHITESFWALIDDSRPSLQTLVSRLEKLPQEEVELFARAFEEAAEEIAEYSNGPDMGGELGALSEDGTEDFCKWVVSQGKTLWERVTAPEVDLRDYVRLYWKSQDGQLPEYPRWDTTVSDPKYRGWQAPGSVAYRVYELRFGRELFI